MAEVIVCLSLSGKILLTHIGSLILCQSTFMDPPLQTFTCGQKNKQAIQKILKYDIPH